MISASETQTYALGRSLAAQLCPGDVLLLRGEMGAGKSVFARGIAHGLGVVGAVASPTFTILNVYDGIAVPLHHFDLYRLEGSDAFFESGLEDYVGGDAITLIEWPERAMDALPADHLLIEIAYTADDEMREIAITPQGGFREVTLQ